jgi:hypothetical protein
MKTNKKKFNDIMEFSISAVNLMNPSVQRIILTEQDFNQEQLALMTDMDVRLQVIRNVYISTSVDNVINLIDDENELKTAEKNMWSVLKHWDNL